MRDLNELTASAEEIKRWLRGSHVRGDAASFRYWYKHRQPISTAIDRSGSLLDIGCANGFLLRCLIAWTNHELVPYGIDPDAELIAQCLSLFPNFKDHFAVTAISKLNELESVSLPSTYTFVYWNVWDDFRFDDEQFAGCLEKAYAAVEEGGRLILGFYDADRAKSKQKLDWLDANFLPVRKANLIDNAPYEEFFVWWDKKVTK